MIDFLKIQWILKYKQDLGQKKVNFSKPPQNPTEILKTVLSWCLRRNCEKFQLPELAPFWEIHGFSLRKYGRKSDPKQRIRHISLPFAPSNSGQKTDPPQNQKLSGVYFLTRIARMHRGRATAILWFLMSRNFFKIVLGTSLDHLKRTDAARINLKSLYLS